MTLEQLQLKRAGLVAQKDQLAANINATIGAIAMCDELIASEQEATDDALGKNETPAVELPVPTTRRKRSPGI